MSEGEPNLYTLDKLSVVAHQIQTIAAKAEQAGLLLHFVNVLREAVERLQHDPLSWGDPVYRLKLAGGVFCHGLIRPIVFHYVVFEERKLVILVEVREYTSYPG